MGRYSSNCPVSRPVFQNIRADKDFQGLSWNDDIGLFFSIESELLPIKLPPMLSYRPTVR